MRSVVALWALIAGALVLVCALIVAVVWLAGGLDTSGDHLNWNAIAALAGIASALAAAGAVATLRFAVQQIAAQREQIAGEQRSERIGRQPYLRVDIGFQERIARHRGFEPPETPYVFTAKDFGLESRLSDLEGIRTAPGEPGFSLVLWVTNLQTAALGIAYRVSVRCDLAWGESDRDNAGVVVDFAYIQSGRTTAVEITRVRRDVPWFSASVGAVQYADLFGKLALTDHHGALEMMYDHNGVRNERKWDIKN
jgi:hypothetical protein